MGLFYKYKNFNEFPKMKSPLSSTAGDTFRAVFVPPRVLEHGWGHVLPRFCSLSRAIG